MSLTVPSASAASVTYPGGAATQFKDSAGGWTSGTNYEGLCIQGLTCPSMAGVYKSSGGMGGNGDGYIRSTAGPTTVAALLSGSHQTWTSPAFVYKGFSGKKPAALTFKMMKRSGFGALLALGADARFRVTALNLSGGPDRVLVADRSVEVFENWTMAANEPLLAGSLKRGDSYAIAIQTSVGGLAAVLPGGHVDYDSVALIATRRNGNNGGGDGNNGNGNNGNSGPKRFRPVITKATKTRGPVTVRKRARKFRAAKVKCRKAPCRIKRVKVRYIIRGKTYHRGKAKFPRGRFRASKSRFVKVTMPMKIFRKAPRGRKIGFVKVRVVAVSKHGARSARNIAIGIGKK